MVQNTNRKRAKKNAALPERFPVSRILRILHRTEYRYDRQIVLNPHQLMLRPRDGHGGHIWQLTSVSEFRGVAHTERNFRKAYPLA